MDLYYFILSLALTCTVGTCYSSAYRDNNNNNFYDNENHKYCDDLSPYFGNFTLDQITGVWNGVEKISHSKGEYRIEHTRDCFYINIREVFDEYIPPTQYTQPMNTPYGNRNYGLPEQHRVRHLILEWHEGLIHDNYDIKVNTAYKGFWPTNLPNGAVDDMYRYFGGVIQVLKVSTNYLVLNFCLRLPHSQLYSVVLSRSENQLTAEDLAGIHNIFTIKHLSTSSLKRVCDSGAATYALSALLSAITIIIWLVLV